MKKLIALLLAMILVTNLATVWLLLENNRLLKQSLDASVARVKDLKNDASASDTPPQQSNPASQTPQASGDVRYLDQVSEVKYLDADGSWHFHFSIENTTSTKLYIRSLAFLDNGNGMDKRLVDQDPMLFESMMGPNPGQTPLLPGEMMMWGDAHPGEYLTSRTYRFEFLGDDGMTYIAEYAYDLRMETADGQPSPYGIDYSTDQGQDLFTLRHEADFQVDVAPGVYWVPVNILGKSGYSNQQIAQLRHEGPEVRQQEIHTLYEALQLYQVSGFVASDDNIRIEENGIHWEHHKPGYHAVNTNNGCCATSANWLNYILAGDYEEVGYIATSQRDGNGHIYNYIFQDGWYYFIDLTHYRTDWIATAVEDGNLDSYYASDFVLGNCHRAKTVQAFVDYVQDAFGDPPGLMFQYTATDCLSLDSARRGNTTVIIYEKDPQVQLNVIFDDPNDNLEYEQVDPPHNRPNWN